MLKLSDKFNMAHHNGYFIAIERLVRGSNSKKAGEVYNGATFTYPTLLSAWEALKLKGVDSIKILSVGEQLIKNTQIKQGKQMAAARETAKLKALK